MKGLRRYIKKHGRHLTEELARAVVFQKWSSKQVETAIQKEIWYNVTESTLGDIIYLVNVAYVTMGWSKGRCIKVTLASVEDYPMGQGLAFDWFLKNTGKGFDITSYI